MWALESYDGFSVLRWEEKLQPHYNPLDIHVTGCHVTLPPLDDGGGKGEQRLAGKHKNGKKGTLCSTAPARGPPPSHRLQPALLPSTSPGVETPQCLLVCLPSSCAALSCDPGLLFARVWKSGGEAAGELGEGKGRRRTLAFFDP